VSDNSYPLVSPTRNVAVNFSPKKPGKKDKEKYKIIKLILTPFNDLEKYQS
jgi:hypothetical protein